MGNTAYLKFKGKVAWAKVYDPDDYEGEKQFKINFYPDSIQALRDKGIQQKVKEDDGGKSGVSGEVMTFRRPVEKEFTRGEITKLLPPTIYDKDGKKIVWYKRTDDGEIERYGEPVLIGNGSYCELTLEVYPAGRMGKGARLNSVKIIDLIEYEGRNEEVTDEEIEAAVERGEIQKSKVSW